MAQNLERRWPVALATGLAWFATSRQGKTEIFHVSLIGLLFGLYHDANEKNNNEPPYEGPLTLYAGDYTI